VLEECFFEAQKREINPQESPVLFKNLFNSVLKKKIQRAVVLSVAEKDSLSAVSYEDVDKNLTERIDFFVSQLGSVEALEKEMGLSLGEIKAQHFEEVREELLINNFKFSLFSDVYITRQEVVDFYNNNPDSIPLSPSVASFSLIEKKVELNKKTLDSFLSSLSALKDSLSGGLKDFTEVAIKVSEDPSVSQNKGIMTTQRGDLVAEYEKTAYGLSVGEIGGPVQTPYGYHLIKLVDRVGEKITSQHILKTKKPSDLDFRVASNYLDSVLVVCKNDPGLFDSLAFKNKVNQNNLSGIYEKINVVNFPGFLVDKVRNMSDYSFSDVFKKDDKVYLLYKYNYNPEKKSTLKENWQEIEAFALNNKIENLFESWVEKKYEDIYVKINPIY
jgi:peptidyl-prolyl cis-trans isomerase SurA